MRILVDECTGPSVAKYLQNQGNDVYSVSISSPGWTDYQVLNKAVSESRVIITNDKDFGDMIFREKLAHCGIILMRLEDESPANKITVLSLFLQNLEEQITDKYFIVLTEKLARIRKI
jgi:predicted nuclease of predicted toxin-antitoxin system